MKTIFYSGLVSFLITLIIIFLLSQVVKSAELAPLRCFSCERRQLDRLGRNHPVKECSYNAENIKELILDQHCNEIIDLILNKNEVLLKPHAH